MGMPSIQTQAEAKQKILDLQERIAYYKTQAKGGVKDFYKDKIDSAKHEIARIKAQMPSLPKK